MNSNRILLIVAGLLIILPSLLLFPSHAYATAITLNSSSGAVGSPITITGDGFVGKSATIFWDDKKLVEGVPVSNDGQINYTFNVPSTPGGDYTVKVSDDSNWTTIYASQTFSVTPSITTEPLCGKPGEQIIVFGTGFAPSEGGIDVQWDGKDIVRSLLAADRTGSWDTMFVVPNSDKGEYTVSASGSVSKAQDVPVLIFTIGPFCTATPLSGPVGTTVTISGKGFRSGEDGLTFTWDGPILDMNFIAQPNGTFSWPITVPPSIKGTHTLGIYGSSWTPKGIVPDIQFEVTPSIQLSSSGLIDSRDVTVSGDGFNANESIAIMFDQTNTGAATTTDDKGSFNVTFQAPFSPGKDHTVIATGSKGAVAQAIYTSTMTPPPTPQLLGPESGAKIQTYNSVVAVIFSIFKNVGGFWGTSDSSQKDSVLTTLSWKISGDSTGITYTLQLSKSSDFSDNVLLKDDITTSSSDLYKSNLLSSGTYYWRVKATDNAGGVSAWSNSGYFDFVTVSSLVMTLSVTIIIFLFAAVALGIFALINRNKRR